MSPLETARHTHQQTLTALDRATAYRDYILDRLTEADRWVAEMEAARDTAENALEALVWGARMWPEMEKTG